MEYWDLYDKDRNKIEGMRVGRNEPIEGDYYHIVVTGWILNDKGQFLITKRHPKKDMFPGVWESPGGAVIEGESAEEAICRELKEEIGISFKPEDARRTRSIRKDDMKEFYDAFLFEHTCDLSELTFQEDEVVDAKWLYPEEIFNLQGKGLFHPFIKYVDEMVKYSDAIRK